MVLKTWKYHFSVLKFQQIREAYPRTSLFSYLNFLAIPHSSWIWDIYFKKLCSKNWGRDHPPIFRTEFFKIYVFAQIKFVTVLQGHRVAEFCKAWPAKLHVLEIMQHN